MLLVFLTCASILSPSPGCRTHRAPVYEPFIPTGCAARIQELVAERSPFLRSGEVVVRYACERRRNRQEADASALDR